MAKTSFVETAIPHESAVVQGFPASAEDGIEPYVFIGVTDDGSIFQEITLTPENAHILSEEIRKHAEYAVSAEEEK